MNSLKFQPLLMKAFTKKVLLEMSDKGKVIFFPYYTITKNIWWKRFRANLECGLFSTKLREEKLQPQPWDW